MTDMAAAATIDALSHVTIQVLGGFAVAIDAAEIPTADWPSLRSAQLVQMLSVADGHRLLREQVIDALWPQLDRTSRAINQEWTNQG